MTAWVFMWEISLPMPFCFCNRFSASRATILTWGFVHPVQRGRALTNGGCQGTLRSMVATREEWSPQLRRGVLEFCVLALVRGGERYGFELVRALSDVDGLVTTEGTLYPLLGRLRREGLVETEWKESPSGPPRRYYSLTAGGRARLAAFVEEWTRFRDGVDALLGTGGSP